MPDELFPLIPYIGIGALIIAIFLSVLIHILERNQFNPTEESQSEAEAEERVYILEKPKEDMDTEDGALQMQGGLRRHVRCRSWEQSVWWANEKKREDGR
jgi:Mg2+/citrate symporter